MKTELKFFWIPVVDHAEATKALNACLVSNTVLDIEKSLVERPQPGWSVCVTVAQQALESGSRATSKKSRVDYREVLDEETFRIFSGLRETRKALAAQDGVPLYTIANNEQLADIAGRRLTDPTDFSSVAGFGGVKQTKYAIPLAESCKALVGGAAPVSVVAANGVRTPMKRVGFLMQDIACYQNVAAAYVLARRGKRQRHEVQIFEFDLSRNLSRLVRDLLDEAWMPSGYRCFVVRDPKHRLIHAAPFADRVAHHALMRIAGPVLERGAIDHSYACRKGKGSHAAIRQAHRMLRRHGMALHLDIRKYFDSISHNIIHELLWRKIKDVPFLCTLDRILLSYETMPGRGLPIGSLTSQYLANMFLDGLDHWLCAHADCRAHVRYMDDLVLFHPDAAALRRIRGEIVDWLHEHRELELKTLPEPVSAADGFHFLGTRITERGVFLARSGRKRWARHMHDLHLGILDGSISGIQAQRKSDALFGSIQHTRSGAWRRKVLESLPEVDL